MPLTSNEYDDPSTSRITQDDILRQQSREIHGGKRNQFISVMRQDCKAIDVKYINCAKDNEIRENNKNVPQEYYVCTSLHV